MTFSASGTLEAVVRVQYLHKLVQRELFRQFDYLYTDVEGKNPLTVEDYILVLSAYYFPVNLLSNKKGSMQCGMRRPKRLKVRGYTARLNGLNKLFALFLWENLNKTIGVMELIEVLSISMPNIWSKQAYLKIFDCESITLNDFDNMFECMDIVESIYKGVVEPSYKKTLSSRLKRGESA